MPVIGYVSGNSVGHLGPLVTIAKEHKKIPNISTVFFTTKKEIDTTYIENIGKKESVDIHISYELQNIPDSFFAKIFYVFKVFYFIILSLFALWKYEIQELHTTGSYIALPICAAATVLRVPIYLYHIDAYPGKASHMLEKYATTIYYAFEITKKNSPKYAFKMVHKPYPIKYSLDQKISIIEAKKKLGIPINKKVIFIFGGSQGSIEINDACIEAIKDIDHNNFYIFHQTGISNVENIKKIYKDNNINVIVQSFYNDLSLIYSAADFIITRAGAGALAEIAFFGKKALIIPLKNAAQNHQVKNAELYINEYPQLMSMTISENNELIHEIKNYLLKI